MKRTGVVILLVLATLLWTVGIVAVWAQRQLLDTQNWVQTSDRLLENQQIREALSTAILQRVYASAPVENKLRETLPPNLQPLAGPIAAALREVANRNAPKVLGSAAAQVAWEKANRTAHRQLLAVLNGDVARGGTVTLNLHDLIAQVAAGTGLPAGVADRLPANLQQLQVLKTDKIEAAQKTLKTAKTLVIVIIVVTRPADGRRDRAVDRSPAHRRGVRRLRALRGRRGSRAAQRRRRRRGQRARRGPERAPGGQGRLRDRDVAAHRCGVGLDRLRPLPDHGRLARGLGAARDGDPAGERPGAARARDLLPRRAGPAAAAARGLGAGAVDALVLAGADLRDRRLHLAGARAPRHARGVRRRAGGRARAQLARAPGPGAPGRRLSPAPDSAGGGPRSRPPRAAAAANRRTADRRRWPGRRRPRAPRRASASP